jgi:phytoene synthase
MPDAFKNCEELVRSGDKDRFLATLFAPEKYRRALFVLYAFNLEIARVRDVARQPMPGEIRLQWWRDALFGGGGGEAGSHPVATALREVVVRYRLPLATFEALIDARAFDLYSDPMPDLDTLEGYARQTAAAPIGLAARILQDGRVSGADELIGHAGVAYAIVRLLQALPIHSTRGQLYIPLDVLQGHGARPEDVLAGEDTPELRAALAELRLRARQHLKAAGDLLGEAPEPIMPALLPVALVRPAIDQMEKRSYRPFAVAETPQWRRQWALWRAARNPARIFS